MTNNDMEGKHLSEESWATVEKIAIFGYGTSRI